MEDKYTSKLSPATDYSAGMFLVVIAVLSIFGNAAVLATAAKRLTLLKAPELLTVNLALTDIGMALSMYPLSIASAFNHTWVGGDPACVYYGLMGSLFSVASIMTLTVLGMVRYLITGTQHRSGNKFQKKTIMVMITFIWLYAVLWAALPVLGWGYYGPEPFGLACSVDWAGYQHSLNGSTFILAISITCTFMPCLAIIFSYSGIAWKLHKAYQAIENNQNLPKSGSLERRFTLMAVLISSGFIVSWTPYVAVSFWTMFHPKGKDSIAPIVSLLPCLFAKCSTAYNPFIYYIFRRSFRREIGQIKCCCALWMRLHAAENSLASKSPDSQTLRGATRDSNPGQAADSQTLRVATRDGNPGQAADSQTLRGATRDGNPARACSTAVKRLTDGETMSSC
ncbi:opsin 8, group member a [Megalops cyprinoides]|uniref:opsin 8, group member a n=1 Tax=Megalops cyprinoides TaxID=118141 RepID=UPI0018648764|nr:opsin 8, group member a [Megalops cyprinoides]